VLSTSIDSFSIVENVKGTKTVVRRTVTVSQVVYMEESEYLRREAGIRAAAMSDGKQSPTESAPIAVPEVDEARDTDPGSIPELEINTDDEEFSL